MTARVLAVLFLVCACPLTTVAQDKEPEIDGKPLSHWIKTLKDQDGKVRREAAAKLSKAPAGVVRARTDDLLELAKDESADVRALACYVLGNIQPDPRTVVPQLADTLLDKNSEVRRVAAQSLARLARHEPKIGKPLVVEKVEKVLKSDNPDIRVLGVYVLSTVPEPKTVLPLLKPVLSDPHEKVREEAKKAIERIETGKTGDDDFGR